MRNARLPSKLPDRSRADPASKISKGFPIFAPRTFALLSCLSASVLAVEPVLVADLASGTADGFSTFSLHDRAFRGTAKLGDDLYLVGTSDSAGTELFRIRQGKLELVADLEPGPKGSKPIIFAEMGGAIYFPATTMADGAGIWKTDGTATTLAIKTANTTRQADNLFVTGTGRMFFNQGSQLFVTDGTTEGTRAFPTTSSQVFDEDDRFGPNAIVSGDSLVFIANKGDTLQLWSARDSLHRLVSMSVGSRISTTGGLRRIGRGFDFCFTRQTESSPDRLISWKPGSDRFEYVFNSSRDTIAPYRFLRVGDTLGMLLLHKDGFYRVDGTTPSSISASYPDALAYFDPLAHVNFGGKLLFHLTDISSTVQTTVAITDGSSVSEVFTGDPYLSNFIAEGNTAFFMNGITNGFRPLIHYVKAPSYQTGVLWSSPDRTRGTPLMALVGVQGSTLYFISSLNPSVGLELYGLALPKGIVETSSKAFVRVPTPGIRTTSRGLFLDAPGSWQVDLLDLRGRFLSRQTLATTGFHPWPSRHAGIAVARIRTPEGSVREERVRLDR